MPVRLRFAALVLVSLLLTWHRPSWAQGGPAPAVVIAWTAPPGCPGVDEVTADIERILGRPLAGTAVTIQAHATVTMDGSGTFRLHLETTEQDGTHARDLEGRTCANVARATALIIALAVDPEAGTRSASAPTAPDTPRPSPAPPLVPALRVAPGRPASSSRPPSLPIGPWLLRVAGADPDPLAAEDARLREAQAFMRAGDAAGALRTLDEFAASHPDGVLQEERRAARVLALSAAGRVDEACAEAWRFLRETPRSPLAERVRASCGVAAGASRDGGPGGRE
jgi:hypothetical protein